MILEKAASALGFYTPEGKLLSAVAVGQHPHEMVLSPDRRYLYTTDNGTMRIEHAGAGGNTISIIDVKARKKVGEISLGKFHRPHGIDLVPNSTRLVVTAEAPDQLLLVDIPTRKVIKTFDPKGKTPHMVTAGPNGRWAYTSNSTSASISAVNLETGEVKVIPTGERPEGSILSKDGRQLLVVNREAASITVIDTTRQERAGRIATGKGPVRISRLPDGTLVYALMHENVIELADPGTRKVTGRIPVPAKAPIVSLTTSPDGRLAFASAEEAETVYVVSLPDRKVVREIRLPAGTGPDPVLEIP